MTIAVKLGLVMGAMTAILVVVASVLFVQLRQVTTTYDGILGSQVHAALQAREMQVDFKKQVQEWKDILLRGFAPADLATYTTQFHDQSAAVDRLGAALVETAPDDTTRDQVRQFLAEHAALDANYEAALGPFVAAGAKDPTVPDRAVRGQDRPPTDRIDDIVARLETAVTDRVAAQNAHVAAQQHLLVAVGLLALVLLLATLAFVVAGVVRPLRALTRAAYRAANETLPEAIGRIRRSPGEAPPSLPALEVGTRDELRDLADALGSMQDSAVALAFDQHRAEREAAGILVNLGRRNQSLLKRTLGYISELEADEHDPEVLGRLFRLDHATTRIRRNAESMLVLAGAEQTRTWSRPVPVAELVRAALSEIEDYARVDLHHVEDGAVVGAVVTDVVHLVAELTENATHFSPPTSRVVVLGTRTPDGYRIRVVDRGVGMTAAEMAAANARIDRAADARSDSPLLGLYVVGRLAARHDIAVELEPSAGVGITATITLPAALLVDVAAPPAPGSDAPTAEQPVVPPLAAVVVPAPRAPVAVPAMPEPRGRAWTVPPEAVSAEAGTLTGWFHALADPAPDVPAPPPSAVPRRVRGAQLPDLGDGRAGEQFAAPDPDQVRRQLSALHLGVERAQAEQAGHP